MISFYSNLPAIRSTLYRSDENYEAIHPSACFITVLDGSLRLEVGQASYPLLKETVFYLAPDTAYRAFPEQTVLLLYTELHPCFLLQTLGFRYKAIALHSSQNPLKDFSELISCIADIAISLPDETGHNCLAIGKACEMLDYVSESYLNPMDKKIPADKVQNKIRALQDYLSARYQIPVSLSETAMALGITAPYLSNFTKKHFHVTFQEYVNSFRLEAAVHYLKYTMETPGRIAALCGFPNLPSFAKAFSETYHQTVEKYITDNRKDTSHYRYPAQLVCISDHALKMDYLFHYTNRRRHYTAAVSDPPALEITLNTLQQKPLPHPFHQLIHLGNAPDFENPAFRRQLVMLLEDMNFAYGKITGLFSDTGICDQNYDFTKAFRILDFLKEIGIRPFLELSNKPFHLYKENEYDFPDYDAYLMPDAYDRMLYAILPAFLKACINRYGYTDVSAWKFELWQRYNPALTSIESPLIYYRRFQRAASIIKNLIPECALGGPCFNPYLDTEKFKKILAEFSQKKGHQPDFLSACYFPYIPDKPYSEDEPAGSFAAQSPNLMSEKTAELKEAAITSGFPDTPLYITEFGAYLSIRNFINDSLYPAVFILHQAARSRNHADLLAYWVVSDLSLEYGKYALPLFGGNGLLSKDGIPKPAYHALAFLNTLGDTLIGSGDYYIAARSADGTIQILVYYISKLNLAFSRSPKSQKLLHYPYSPFEEVPPLDMHFTLTNLHPGRYTIKERPLDLNHSNVLSAWGSLDYAEGLQPADIEYLRMESRITVHGKTEALQSTCHLHTRLNANEAKLFTIRPQSSI